MQLFAANKNGEMISVQQANRQENYICLECKGLVRRRAGLQRTPHFFHLRHTTLCRLSNKSLPHLQTQRYLQSLFPLGDCELEHPFPRINRIADVVWISRKMIFEVQCSPIDPQEIHNRNRDYSREGYQVIWILHDKRYNQWKVSSAEYALRHTPHYFTNMNDEGVGLIYDQDSLINHGIRKARTPIVQVDLARPQTIKKKQSPESLKYRELYWPLHFAGDLLDLGIAPVDLQIRKSLLQKFINLSLHPYRSIFRMLLEKACK